MDADIKAQLKTIMEYHRGRNNPILRKDLRKALGMGENEDRKLRLIIGEIRHDKINGLPILFATQKPAGYYIPDNQKELDEGREALKQVVKDECITLAMLKTYGQRFLTKETQGVLIK